jgi:hypothetical protein
MSESMAIIRQIKLYFDKMKVSLRHFEVSEDLYFRIILINLVKFNEISDSKVTFSDTFPILKLIFPILKMAYLLVSDTSDTFLKKNIFWTGDVKTTL